MKNFKALIYGAYIFSILVIFGGLFYVFKNIGEVSKPEDSATANQNVKSQKPKDIQNPWVRDLAEVKKREFSYPVNDLFIKIEFAASTKNTKSNNIEKSFRLLVENINNYSLFCITWVLSSKNIAYTIIRDGESAKIFINAAKQEDLKEITKDLEKYDIKSNIIEV